jgi:Skp family chaperone for outer membrane proteins
VFKKLLTLMMVVSIFTVQAQASTQNGLKAAFDEMNYSLTVEWDQKDNAVYEAQLKKFTGVVRDLQKQGLTNSQMIAFAKSEVKDAKVAKDLETAFSMITINKMSSEDASKYMMDSMKRSYSSGAAWNGDVLTYLAVGLLIVALAVGVAKGNVAVVAGNGGYGSSCYDDCYYYDYSCGYDYYGPIYCQTYTCDTVCY